MATDSSSIRPTKGVVIRALSDILRPVIQETVVLELFSGTGRVGAELLEEGAELVVGVDLREAPKNLPHEYQWIRRDVHEYLQGSGSRSFDIIFMDPPYGTDHASRVLSTISSSDLLNPRGIVAVETDLETDLPEEQPVDGRLFLMRRRKYGDTRLRVYQADREEPGYQ